MDYPQYKYAYCKIKCYDKTVFVDTVSTYEYNPEHNTYVLIKTTCSLNQDRENRRRCHGRTKYNNLCTVINPLPIEIEPDDPLFDEQSYLID